MSVIILIRPTHFAYFNVIGVATLQTKNRLFCLQYLLRVLTSDVVLVLRFPDSTCSFCVIIYSLLL